MLCWICGRTEEECYSTRSVSQPHPMLAKAGQPETVVPLGKTHCKIWQLSYNLANNYLTLKVWVVSGNRWRKDWIQILLTSCSLRLEMLIPDDFLWMAIMSSSFAAQIKKICNSQWRKMKRTSLLSVMLKKTGTVKSFWKNCLMSKYVGKADKKHFESNMPSKIPWCMVKSHWDFSDTK